MEFAFKPYKRGVKAQNQKTVFGILIKFNGAELTVRSGNEAPSKIIFKRYEVIKSWSAKLKNGRKTGKDALIGAGSGATIGSFYVAANRKSGDGQIGIAIPVLAVFGSGIGAAVGFFARNRNRKKQLIYQR